MLLFFAHAILTTKKSNNEAKEQKIEETITSFSKIIRLNGKTPEVEITEFVGENHTIITTTSGIGDYSLVEIQKMSGITPYGITYVKEGVIILVDTLYYYPGSESLTEKK